MPAVRSGRRAMREEEQLGLLEIARARGTDAQEDTLPPGRRDASGFWFPAGYRDPMELFTPHQRSLQAKQRVLKSRRARPAPGRVAPPAETVTRPLLIADAAPAPACSLSGSSARPRDTESRAQREPGTTCVDSPRRSV